MDWHSRYVLAWRLSNTLEVDFCVEALEEALSKGRPQIFNTDQGSQFTSEAFTSILGMVGIKHILASPFHPQTNCKLACRRTDVSWQRAFVRQGDSMTRGARTTVSNRRC